MRRREFIETSCKSCAAVGLGMFLGSSFLEACVSGKLSVIKATANNDKILLPLNGFSNNDAKLVRVTDYPFDIAVKKQNDNDYLALVMMCTHAGHPLLKSGNTYYCTLHGSRFKDNGNVETGPASKALMHLPVGVSESNLEITLLKPVY